MEEQVQIDSADVILDLNGRGLSEITLSSRCPRTQALLLSGNSLQDFDFLRNFEQLKLLHAD